MKRSRAFVLSEILITMMLQAGFILVLCTSFYLLTSFYTKSQEVLTARNHAERVIQFMDDKIRNAGLGMWDCTTPTQIREALGNTATDDKSKIKNFRLPVAIRQMKNNKPDDTSENTPIDGKYYGDILTLYYAQRDNSSDGNEVVLVFRKTPTPFEIRLIDITDKNKKLFQDYSAFEDDKNPVKWAVAESIGKPFYISKINYPSVSNGINMDISFYGTGSDAVNIHNGGELMYLRCMQIYTHTDPTEKNRQLAFRELNANGQSWTATDGFNQEENVLETYMELDTSTNIFTLYVLAQGGYDASASNPRPEIWPIRANPSGDTQDKANENWLKNDYSHYVTYVARKSWKLNNIPAGFNWN